MRKSREDDWLYYDPFAGQKLSQQAAEARASTARVLPEYLPKERWHEDNYVERTPRDVSLNYVPYADRDGSGGMTIIGMLQRRWTYRMV